MKKTLAQNLKNMIVKSGTPIMVVTLDDSSPAKYVKHEVVTYSDDFNLKGLKRLDGRFAGKKLVDAGHRVYSAKINSGWVQYAIDGDMTIDPRGPNNSTITAHKKLPREEQGFDCRGYGYIGKYFD